jgi:hypothetical protein
MLGWAKEPGDVVLMRDTTALRGARTQVRLGAGPGGPATMNRGPNLVE